jgi:hypothetical protein
LDVKIGELEAGTTSANEVGVGKSGLGGSTKWRFAGTAATMTRIDPSGFGTPKSPLTALGVVVAESIPKAIILCNSRR